MSYKIFSAEKIYKYFTAYFTDDFEIMLLHILLPKTIGYVNVIMMKLKGSFLDWRWRLIFGINSETVCKMILIGNPSTKNIIVNQIKILW